MNNKVAIYTRVSTHWQADKDSLQVQRRELIAYSQLILNCDDYTVFEDAGYSAKNTDRPEYQEMMTALRSGKYSHLLVWKIDRISRNLLDFSNMYAELKDLGVIFVSKNEQFDTSTAIGEAMLKIILVFAELERKMTSERVSAVMLSRANNGQWNGGKIPFGYNYDKKTKLFSINEQESNTVKLIYRLYEQSQSILYVVRYLNSNKIPTRNNSNWSAASVHKILTNIFYCGSYQYNKRNEKDGFKQNPKEEWIIIQNHHEPIISSDTHNNVSSILQKNRRLNTDKTYIRKNIHIFSGLLYCSNCNRKLNASLDKPRETGYRPSIYCCPNRRNHSCPCKYISDTYVGQFVFSYLASLLKANQVPNISFTDFQSMVTPPSVSVSGLEKTYELIGKSDEFIPIFAFDGNSYNDIYRHKTKCETALKRLRNLYLYDENAMSEKDYIIEKQSLESELAKIEEQLSTAGPSEDYFQKASYFIIVQQLLKDNIDYENYISCLDHLTVKNFLNQCISRIEIDIDKIRSITFKNGITHIFSY